jgi:hypothetical protein
MLCIGASECMRILRQPLFPKTHLFRQNSSVTAMAVCKRIKSGSRLRRGELGA